MKLAITDACIFIDLCDLEIVSAFFQLAVEIHTSFDVFNELYPEQQDVLKQFQAKGQLTVHSISEQDRRIILETAYPRSLSDNDKTVLYLAKKLHAMVLSSDKTVRHFAKGHTIEHHGMIWVFDELVASSLLPAAVASTKLQQLIHTNFIYRNNAQLVSEMNTRLKKWQK